MPRPRRSACGFTLTELAVVMAIVALLLGGLMLTLSTQVDQRNAEETRRRLDVARELLLAYAIVNGRLPCPARSTSAGAEVRDSSTERCTNGVVEDWYGGSLSGGVTGGLLPAQTIGYPQVDAEGFAVDAWQNRIRYSIAQNVTSCAGTPTNPHFVSRANMRANGLSCQSNDLLVCKSATGISATSCGGSANQIVTQGVVAAIVFSTGKNGTTGGTGTDEAANLDGNATFVWHTPTTTDAANGEFDDQFTWITVGELYGRLISGGVLP